jgi:negative regulator of flagellin synthesis FlgM
MKIENTGSQHPLERARLQEAQAAAGARPAPAGDRAQGADRRDQLTLSDQAQVLARARAALNEVPDVRVKKVAELRQSVEAGTYQVPHQQLVRRLRARLAGTL